MPTIPADMQAIFAAEAEEAMRAETDSFEAFATRHNYGFGNAYATELWVRYRELAGMARQEWALNMGGQL
jgi:hypothetical protein